MIRNAVILIALGFLLLPAMAAAEASPAPPGLAVTKAEDPPHNGIHIDPASLAFGVVGIGYERVILPRVSLLVAGQYVRSTAQDVSIHAFGVRLQPRVYLLRPAPGGLYLAPSVQLASASTSGGTDVSGSALGYAVGATVGWSWVWDWFNLKLGGGVQYVSMAAEATSSAETRVKVGLEGVYPAADLTLGIVF